MLLRIFIISMLFFVVASAMSDATSFEQEMALSYKSFGFPNGTHVVGLCRLLTNEEITNGAQISPGFEVHPPRAALIRPQFNRSTQTVFHAALIIHSIYQLHSGAPMNFRNGVRWAVAPEKLIRELSFNETVFVEIEIIDGIGHIVNVLPREEGCTLTETNKALGLNTFMAAAYVGTGPPNSYVISCTGRREAGWTRKTYAQFGEYMLVKYPE